MIYMNMFINYDHIILCPSLLYPLRNFILQ
jgi:hypothetical protein